MKKNDVAPTILPLSRIADPKELDPVSSGIEARGAGQTPPLTVGVWSAVVDAMPLPVLVLEDQFRVVIASAAARALFESAGRSFVGYSAGRYLSIEKLEAARIALLSRPGAYSYPDVLMIDGVEVDVKVSCELVDIEGTDLMVLTVLDRSLEVRERLEMATEPAIPSEPPVARIRQARHFEVLGHLTGTLAHDFSNLLSVILGSLESAKRRMNRGMDPMPDIERAILAAERSAEATSEVLHYSRRRDTPVQGVLPADILRELSGLLERAMDKRGELEIQIQECPAVACEAAQLETAILNLVINSRDSLGADGKVVVSCKPRLVADGDSAPLGILPGQYVAIRVSDNGSGIPEEVRTHVFEPFFTTKPEGVGTGLGLSTVKAFVRRRGGAVWLETKVSEGTSVELLLPAL